MLEKEMFIFRVVSGIVQSFIKKLKNKNAKFEIQHPDKGNPQIDIEGIYPEDAARLSNLIATEYVIKAGTDKHFPGSEIFWSERCLENARRHNHTIYGSIIRDSEKETYIVPMASATATTYTIGFPKPVIGLLPVVDPFLTVRLSYEGFLETSRLWITQDLLRNFRKVEETVKVFDPRTGKVTPVTCEGYAHNWILYVPKLELENALNL